VLKQVSELKRSMRELACEDVGMYLVEADLAAKLEAVRGSIRQATPTAVCVYCGGEGCNSCRGKGWLSKAVYDAAPASKKDGGAA